MRRWIALVLLALLPLQWGVALALSVGEPVGITTEQHLANHHHGHADAAAQTGQDSDAANHGDCGACVHQVAQAAAAFTHTVVPPAPARVITPYARHVPEALAERLYRPPLARAA
jgi:hypothetical protein